MMIWSSSPRNRPTPAAIALPICPFFEPIKHNQPGWSRAQTARSTARLTVAGPTVNGTVFRLVIPRPQLQITPDTGFVCTGYVGGPFFFTNQNYVLTNTGSNRLGWSLGNSATWLNAPPTRGTFSRNHGVESEFLTGSPRKYAAILYCIAVGKRA
jgi:hypothetical protein